MKNKTSKGLMMVGSVRSAGVTTYIKQGQLIMRSSRSMEKRSNTLGQFVQRMRMRHSVALWGMLKICEPMFTERPTAYRNFLSLANRLQPVYVNRRTMSYASFLMPGIPVSDGKLQPIGEQLGEVDGTPALITNLGPCAHSRKAKLWLFTAVQYTDGTPSVSFSRRDVPWQELTLVDGHYALTGEEFADPMKGWALVLVDGDRCTPQGIVTCCSLYQQYTTDEALQAAAKSYGGITK